MKKLTIVALGGLLVSATALEPTAAAAQEVTLRVHSFLPPVANPIFGSDSRGSNSRYFQIVFGREDRTSRVNFFAIAS